MIGVFVAIETAVSGIEIQCPNKLLFLISSNTSVDSGLSMAEAQKGKAADKKFFERINFNLMPPAPKEVSHSSPSLS